MKIERGDDSNKGRTNGEREGKATAGAEKKRVTNVSHEHATESLPAGSSLLQTCPLVREIFVPEINGIAFFCLNRDSYKYRPTSVRMIGRWIVNIIRNYVGFHI